MNVFEQKVFYLIGGPNGSGKSTFANELLQSYPDFVSINWDDTVKEVYKDNYQGPIDMIKIGKILMAKMQKAFSTQSSIVEETTLAGSSAYKRHIKLAKAAGYELRFLYIVLGSVEQNIARVRQRVAMGGHDVSEEDIRRRYERSMLHFEDVYKMSDQWELYYNGGKNYELLAHGVGENINVTNSPLFAAFKERRAAIVSEHLLEIGRRAAERAAAAARDAGIPIVYVGR